jgi:hypothetical protein
LWGGGVDAPLAERASCVTLTSDSSFATNPGRLSRVRGIARLAVVLEIFLGLGALGGGGLFILAPDGHLLGMTTRMLAGTPFHSFLVPGIILFAFIGVTPLLAGHHSAPPGDRSSCRSRGRLDSDWLDIRRDGVVRRNQLSLVGLLPSTRHVHGSDRRRLAAFLLREGSWLRQPTGLVRDADSIIAI